MKKLVLIERWLFLALLKALFATIGIAPQSESIVFLNGVKSIRLGRLHALPPHR
jgi:hypothetical protein